MALTKVTKGVIKSDIDYEVKDFSASGNVNISGVITASSFSGPSSGTDGNFSGIVTASKFVGDGSELTGVSGFSTALSSEQGSAGSNIFITSQICMVGAGKSLTVTAPADCGGIAFTRALNITVATGATFRVNPGTTLKTNILGLF